LDCGLIVDGLDYGLIGLDWIVIDERFGLDWIVIDERFGLDWIVIDERFGL
jgi:hypothetical protein